MNLEEWVSPDYNFQCIHAVSDGEMISVQKDRSKNKSHQEPISAIDAQDDREGHRIDWISVQPRAVRTTAKTKIHIEDMNSRRWLDEIALFLLAEGVKY